MASISGGDKLEGVLKGISSNLQLKMNVGVLAGSTNEDTGEQIAPYAAANEYGTATIPARPAFRITVGDKSTEWGETLSKLVAGQTQDTEGIEKAFNVLGQIMVQDIRDTIEHSVPPPNKQSTIDAKARKGRAIPTQTLVDSGSYQRSIDYEIIKEETVSDGGFKWWNPLTWFGR